MRTCTLWILCVILLSGCSKPSDEVEVGMHLRSNLLQAQETSFKADITADYGDKIHIFSMECRSDVKGDLMFTVLEPESISGITGKLTGEGGILTFDDTALHFELLADEQLSPISAPWVLMKTLRSGYLTSACTEDGRIRLSIDDSYESDPLRLDIWLNPENLPAQADILYDGRRILSVVVADFEIL